MSLILNIFIGLLVGVVINYFADVLPLSKGLILPICPNCEQTFSLADYLISFSCSKCGKRKPIRWIVVIILSIITSILLTYNPPTFLNFWTSLPIMILFGIIAVIDIEHHAVLIVTVAACFIVFGIYGYIFFGLLGELLGILTGMGITFFLYFLGIVMAKIVGTIKGEEIEEVAFGFGDVLMGTVLGALTGWPSIFGVVVIALISFAVFSIIYFLILLFT